MKLSSPTSRVSVRGLHRGFNATGELLDQLSFERGKLVRKTATVKAINGISLDSAKGEALCLVGESGCGKITVGRTVMGLLLPQAARCITGGSASTA